MELEDFQSAAQMVIDKWQGRGVFSDRGPRECYLNVEICQALKEAFEAGRDTRIEQMPDNCFLVIWTDRPEAWTNIPGAKERGIEGIIVRPDAGDVEIRAFIEALKTHPLKNTSNT